MTDKCPRQVSGEAKHRCWGDQHKCFHMSRRTRWLLDCSHAQGSPLRIGCHLHGTLTFLSPFADRQTDRQTRGLHVYSSLYHVALSLAFSLSFSRSRLLLCWMLDLHSSVSSSSPSMISPHQSKGPKDQPLSDLITLDNRIQLHYKDSKFQLHSEVMGFNYLTKVQATSILSFALAVG
jgi:hypothetical protein